MEAKQALNLGTRWSGLVSAFLVFVLGIVHIATIGARILWPNKFIDDINNQNWRQPLFSFAPSVFCDAWTPIVFGLLGMMLHFQELSISGLCGNMARFFLFNLIMGLWGTIGYVGGLGIIFSIFVWITCLLSLICLFAADSNASLGISLQSVRK